MSCHTLKQTILHVVYIEKLFGLYDIRCHFWLASRCQIVYNCLVERVRGENLSKNKIVFKVPGEGSVPPSPDPLGYSLREMVVGYPDQVFLFISMRFDFLKRKIERIL